MSIKKSKRLKAAKTKSKPKPYVPISRPTLSTTCAISATPATTAPQASPATPAQTAPPIQNQTADTAITAMRAALDSVYELIDGRLGARLSVSRLMGVARELKELLKVMSVYGV